MKQPNQPTTTRCSKNLLLHMSCISAKYKGMHIDCVSEPVKSAHVSQAVSSVCRIIGQQPLVLTFIGGTSGLTCGPAGHALQWGTAQSLNSRVKELKVWLKAP
jgi:hypothetical protein